MMQIIENKTTRVAIPVFKDEGLSSKINAHFGKSRGFILVDSALCSHSEHEHSDKTHNED